MRNRVSRAALPVAAAVLAAVAVLPLSTAATAAVREPAPRATPADWPSYIVTVRRGVDPAAVAAQAGVRPERSFHHALNGFAARLSPAQVAEVAALPGVVSVEPDGAAGPFGRPGASVALDLQRPSRQAMNVTYASRKSR
ncbi:protease inhibitor I9 family protein [Streptomyces sp. NPDC057011]|uniref:protease inhibitor I9 family protein n=1 Tax=unclassified Streptomyces TaxID=2593676 RepID=UPI003641F1EB